MRFAAVENGFIAGVREGFEQLERGEGVAAETVREMDPSWRQKQSGFPGSGMPPEAHPNSDLCPPLLIW